MLSVMTSSSYTDIGYVQQEKYSISQEVGLSTQKSEGLSSTSLETLSVGFFSPSFQTKRARLEFPMAFSLYTRNLGDSSELLGPATTFASIVNGQFSRTLWGELSGTFNWSKTYNMQRFEEAYAIDTGTNRSYWSNEGNKMLPWQLYQGRGAARFLNFFSPISWLDLKINGEKVRASLVGRNVTLGRSAIVLDGTLFHIFSDEHKGSLSGRLIDFDKLFSSSSSSSSSDLSSVNRSYRGTSLQIAFGDAFTYSDVNKFDFGIGAVVDLEGESSTPWEAHGEWKTYHDHHWLSKVRAERKSDFYTLDSETGLRDLGSLSTRWRLYSVMDLGFKYQYSRTKAKTGLKIEVKDAWDCELSGRYYWDFDIGWTGRFAFGETIDRSEGAGTSGNRSLWFGLVWPDSPEKKEL